MQIGNVKIEGHAALAPMAGVADRAMRELCRELGAAYTVSELVSAMGISLGDKKSARLLEVHEDERPMALQLFGKDPAVMAEAARMAMEQSPDWIDINMGCPAPKVTAHGGGATLMKDPALAAAITQAVVKAVRVPVTVKIRAGWDPAHRNAVEVAQRCEAAGAAAITVHGRTRSQMYAPPVDLDIIRNVKQAVQVPVIGNGDIASADDAVRMLEETGCDFLMVGRAAMGAPWLFSQINAWLDHEQRLPEPPVAQRMAYLLRQAKLMAAYKGDYIAMREIRKHAGWYMRGLRGAAEYRRVAGTISSMDELARLCLRVVEEHEGE